MLFEIPRICKLNLHWKVGKGAQVMSVGVRHSTADVVVVKKNREVAIADAKKARSLGLLVQQFSVYPLYHKINIFLKFL